MKIEFSTNFPTRGCFLKVGEVVICCFCIQSFVTMSDDIKYSEPSRKRRKISHEEESAVDNQEENRANDDGSLGSPTRYLPARPATETEDPWKPFFSPSRSLYEFQRLNYIDEGTFGKVYRARDTVSGEIVALKKVKILETDKCGFPLTSLREIKILMEHTHPNVVSVSEVVVGPELDR